jgi:hypothetical protein
MAGFLRFEFLIPPVETEVQLLRREAHGVSFWFRHRKASSGLLGKATSSRSRHIFSARRRSTLHDGRGGTVAEAGLGIGTSSRQKNRMSMGDPTQLAINRRSWMAHGVIQQGPTD